MTSNNLELQVPSSLNHRYYSGIGAGYDVTDHVPTHIELAEVVSSELVDSFGKPTGHHAPVLDIDVSHRLVPSSTEGHSHLYFDTPMTWRIYKKLLKAMGKAGILEPGYVRVSLRRKHTAVRLPWIKK